MLFKKRDTRLRNGSKVAIIGGGPAGCFFALHLLQYARQEGVEPQISLFEARNFSLAGPRNCGKCAGILSFGLQQNLRSFGLQLPKSVIQDKIDSYMLHLAGEKIEIYPPRPDREITSVYRGRGPRLAPLGREVNFDEWLLKETEKAGVRIVPTAVRKLISADRPIIHIENQPQSFDLVVLAAGINSRRLSLSGFDYRSPRTQLMIQDELGEFSDDCRRVHIYFGPAHGMFFGAVVPKGSMASVSLLGRNLNMETLREFMPQSDVCRGNRQLCGCKPRVAVSIAHGYYADRFVAVGDAAATRLYKDGIGSAFLTARRAAFTAIYHGTNAADFRLHYAPLCRKIALDNFFGHLLFYTWSIVARMPALTRLWLRALVYELTSPQEGRRCSRALWNSFTGDDSYLRIFFSLFHPRMTWFFLKVAWRSWLASNSTRGSKQQ